MLGSGGTPMEKQYGTYIYNSSIKASVFGKTVV
jgi:hypothetical protein